MDSTPPLRGSLWLPIRVLNRQWEVSRHSDSTAISDIGADGKDEHYDCIPSLPGWHRARSMPTPSDLQPPPRHPTLRWIDPPRILSTICKKRPALNRSRFGPKTKAQGLML
ncbi:hypothetical protein V6N12_020215 [Hibiscus sabdariffa]|uniref:Uncharacterized protein n=1 Tax=Hibiscus sabdariffa TaxID=183260 RepID=A0ABR2BNF6_9ROSI